MAKKKTTTEKYIEKAVKAAAEELSGNTVQNCIFTGVKWDAKAVDAIQTIADGLIVNAEGLKALAEVLKSSNIQIETLMRVE